MELHRGRTRRWWLIPLLLCAGQCASEDSLLVQIYVKGVPDNTKRLEVEVKLGNQEARPISFESSDLTITPTGDTSFGLRLKEVQSGPLAVTVRAVQDQPITGCVLGMGDGGTALGDMNVPVNIVLMKQTYQLNVNAMIGGTVQGDRGDVGSCKVVRLTATPADSCSEFAGWSSDRPLSCQQDPTCDVPVTGPQNITAMFNQTCFPVTVGIVGNGRVNLTMSTQPGVAINCPPSCTADKVHKGTQITFTPLPGTGRFTDFWSGPCTTNAKAECTVTVHGETSLTATFSHWDSGGMPSGDFRSVWGNNPNSAWAGDSMGNAHLWNGTSWDNTTYIIPQSGSLRGLWGFGPNDIWAVGTCAGDICLADHAKGIILHWKDFAWSTDAIDIDNSLNSVWGIASIASRDIWAVGKKGSILHGDGTTWSTSTSGTGNDLNSVWGTAASDVWAVGDGGTILRWNGSSWTPNRLTNFSSNLESVWGAGADVWAVGGGGQIIHWTGMWKMETSGTNQVLRGVWGSPDSVWAVGDGGTILRSDGKAWRTISSGGSDLWSVGGSSPVDVWVVGNSGTALRYVRGN